ncbi:MAG TPA: hypothetical protein VD794_12700 [Flavisolibacter sp.]|nr:hypothetical protein [Flavisolibacter sp.]
MLRMLETAGAVSSARGVDYSKSLEERWAGDKALHHSASNSL